jgi:hypothetical protein
VLVRVVLVLVCVATRLLVLVPLVLVLLVLALVVHLLLELRRVQLELSTCQPPDFNQRGSCGALRRTLLGSTMSSPTFRLFGLWRQNGVSRNS